MAVNLQPSANVTSSATTETESIVVCFFELDRMVACLPMMLSLTSAFSPIITLSMIADFSITAFLPT